ncbi:MAG: site-specific integrase [Deltaproteobacteria bacterium]|nr:site-specific integrase [Deltaproteobacteria bacterium]
MVRRANKTKNQVVETERTKSISRLYKEGIQDFETCKDQIWAIVAELKAKDKPRITKDINALLKFTGREELLEQSPEESKPVQHLSQSEFELVIKNIKDENIKTILHVAFTTGMRLGEIFGATSFNKNTQSVPVFSQIKINGNRTETKTRIKRFAAVDPLGIKHIKQWLAVDGSTKSKLRKLKFSEITRQACKKAFPHDPEKWCRFHDLRHSYAIHCLSKGIPMDLVALSLGNSITVCQKYYVGFSLTNYQTEIMMNLLNNKTMKAA